MLTCAIERQKAGNSAHVALTPSDWYIIKATEQKNAQGLTVGLWWGMLTGDAMIEMAVEVINQNTAHCKVWLTRPGATL